MREGLRSVVIEEPEMGLHPKAIVSFGLLVLALLSRVYQVILSTHSPIILDLVWAIRELREVSTSAATRALSNIFELERPSGQIRRILEGALRTRTWLVGAA